jgi:conjugative transfer pilus assembly protein TraH
MKKLLIPTIVGILFAVSGFAVKPASADMASFLSTVVSQAQNLTPQAYQAQQRGFLVGGSMNIPSQGVTSNPISFTPPSLSSNGCGSINAVMGGFSYLNPQYLMQKLQGIIQEAPSFALEIAIKVLSEQAGNTMNFLEHVSDLANSLNVNTCGAMNAASTSAANAISSHIGIEQVNAANQQSSGGSSWFGGVMSNINNAENAFNTWWSNNAPSNPNSLLAFENENCPIANGTSGMLRTAADDVNMGNIPPDFIDFIRAYVGDVFPTPNTPAVDGCYFNVTYHSPVGNANFNDLVKSLVTGGSILEISGTGMNSASPTATPVPFTAMQTQVENTLQDLLNNLNVGGGNISAGDIQLINESPLPLYPFLKDAVLSSNTNVAGSIISNISKPIAIGIVYDILQNYIQQVRVMLYTEQGNLKQGVTGTKNIGSEGPAEIKKLLTQLLNAQKVIYWAYVSSLTKMQLTNGNFTSQYSAIQQEVNAEFRKGGYGRYLTKFAGSAGM